MPIHDWKRVDAGVFHDFHNAWTTELRNALNGGLLPKDFYALTEQHAGRCIADVLTLHAATDNAVPLPGGGTAVAEAPPRVRRKLTASASARQRRRTLAVRHVTGHRLVALIEIVSPANKDRRAHVQELASKIETSLRLGVHVLLVDVLPPAPHDRRGIHGAVWELLDEEVEDQPPGEPLTLASYVAGPQPDAYLEHVALGASLPDMPLFLHPERYVAVPLEATYQAAFEGTPEVSRAVLEGSSGAAS
jgi:hypothetical protein